MRCSRCLWPLKAIRRGADLIFCLRVIACYADQWIGVTEASLVVLADRYQTRTICTLDRRHFSILRSLDGQEFTLIS